MGVNMKSKAQTNKIISQIEYYHDSCFTAKTLYRVTIGQTPFVKVSIHHGESESCFLRDRRRFLKRFNLIRIDKWKNDYLNKNVLDGYQWELKVTYADGTQKISGGSNAYPKEFSRLKNLFNDIVLPEPLPVL